MLTETTAELAAALTLAAARRVAEADVFMRAGKYKGWLPTLFIGNLLQVRPGWGPALPGEGAASPWTADKLSWVAAGRMCKGRGAALCCVHVCKRRTRRWA